MPKKSASESVLHDWVHKLTFQQQALLMTGVRGPDGSSKDNEAKYMVRYLRGVVLKPAGDWHGKNDNSFMWGDYDVFHDYGKGFYKAHDEYNHHFIMHLIHCAEVIGYKHPDKRIADEWLSFYMNMCDAMHMHHESEMDMDLRLNDFGCGYSETEEDSVIYRIYKDGEDESMSCTLLGEMQRDVSEETYDKWNGKKEIIRKRKS